MNARCTSWTSRQLGKVFCLIGGLYLFLGWSSAALASFTVPLAWQVSADSTVVGYEVHYGTDGRQFTNVLAVGTNGAATIAGLEAGTPHFFVANSVDRAGDPSPFSNEVVFIGADASAGASVQFSLLPPGYSRDPLRYRLPKNAPAGVSINPTTGFLSWQPGDVYSFTTNFINVEISNPRLADVGFTETVEIVVGGSLNLQVGAVVVPAGQTGSLPLTVSASATVTNLQLALNWPADQLLNPTLTCSAPFVSGSLQMRNGLLIASLQTTAAQPFSGSGQVGRIDFQTARGQPLSPLCLLPFAGSSANAVDGSAYGNVTVQPGEVVIVGNQPTLCPQASESNPGRTLSVYAMPGSYQLWYTTSLVAPVTWQPAFSYQQTNAVQTVTLDDALPVVYYRLQQL